MENNNMYSTFTNKYSLTKTLRFELIPQGRTQGYIEKNGLIEEDTIRAADYASIKKLIDEYHREFIDRTLANVELSSVGAYVDLYNSSLRDSNALEKQADKARKELVKFFTSDAEYKKLFEKDLINSLLPNHYENNAEALELISKFKKFTTYFKGFNENRKNIYTDEAKSTAIAYRTINENLPKFIDNYNTLLKALKHQDIANDIKALSESFPDILGDTPIEEFLSPSNYSAFITQKGIDSYNTLLGGKSVGDREKVQGINEYINQHNLKNKNEKVGFLKPLYQQILSDRESASYLPEQFEDDAEVLNAITQTHDNLQEQGTLLTLSRIIKELNSYDLSHVYIGSSKLNDISKQAYDGEWNHIREALEEKYDKEKKPTKIKDYDKYIEKRKKALDKIKSHSIKELQEACGDKKISEYFIDTASSLLDTKPVETYSALDDELSKRSGASNHKKLQKNPDLVNAVKGYLDALKDAQRLVQPLLGSGDKAGKDARFYGELDEAWNELDVVTPLYNKVRNYVTKKPYSREKIKLNFDNYQLLKGWSLDKENDYQSLILRKDSHYYLGIMKKAKAKEISEKFRDVVEGGGEEYYEKMVYKYVRYKDLAHKFFARKNQSVYNPSQKILNIYNKHKNNKEKDKNTAPLDSSLRQLIDFYKTSIAITDEWKCFDFEFSPTSRYKCVSDFRIEVEDQGYKLEFKKIPTGVVDSLVDEGKLYLFQIYNKDFSPYSKGTPNLHTLYWRALFSEENLRDVVYQLNGGAEVFYRKKSIADAEKVPHTAGDILKNKNKSNEKEYSIFPYDIIKDKRYTVDKYQFHVPITLNFKAHGSDNLDIEVREATKHNSKNYVIGIDRGERHLLYVSVIDLDGNIVEQRTLNQIVAESNGKKFPPVDYHALLDEREEKSDEERKSWQSIEPIKELKEGYLSQAVHYIVKLMVQYNAIVVLEDLNSGFKRSRQKVGKQVYQKFERMFIEKLNYLVDKQLPENELGGLMHAYQLTNKLEKTEKLDKIKQSGFLFYVDPWNTSNIDPVTGFVNLFDTRYKSVASAQDFWSKFDSIKWDSAREMFAFSFKYSNFTKRNLGAKDDWVLYTNGERIQRKEKVQGRWDSKTVDLTGRIKEILQDAGIDYKDSDLQTLIMTNDDKEFHKSLLENFRLTLQMRNSKSGTNIDYIVSPVMDEHGNFFDSRNGDKELPDNADANGAYNIARKGLMIIDRIKKTPDEELDKVNLFIKHVDWLKYAQGLAE